MQTNPDKFQAFFVGPKTLEVVKSSNRNDQEIACQEVVKLLGTELDYMLNSDYMSESYTTAECFATYRQVFIYLNQANHFRIFHTVQF